MQVVEDLEHADQDVAQLDLGEPASLRDLAEVLARHALHDQVERARWLLERRVVAWHTRVAQLRQHFRFALEQLERLPRAARRDSLDHDFAILRTFRLRVLRKEQLALRPFA